MSLDDWTAGLAVPRRTTVAPSPSKIVCVGRNYAAHIAELGHDMPSRPVLFIKPPSSLRSRDQGVVWPAGEGSCHHECELVIRIGSPLTRCDAQEGLAAINGVTLGLDLTLRDLQNELKTKGDPWERCKAFDGACVLGDWLGRDAIGDWADVEFELLINGQVQQHGQTAHMLFAVGDLLADITRSFTLMPGDIVMTGTPSGVSALQPDSQLTMRLHTQLGPVDWTTHVVGPV